MFEYRNVKGHVEVFLDGEFMFSADTIQEAREEAMGLEVMKG